MDIRPALPDDCAAILAIWNPLIRDSHVTFNSEQKTVKMLCCDLANKAALNHPFLVATDGDAVLGFATYGRFRASNGYDRTMEHTIILPAQSHGKGLGRRLMTALEDHARAAGVHVLVAGISHRNPAGLRFHAAVGFAEVGRMPEVGQKFGQRYDLVLMQKII